MNENFTSLFSEYSCTSEGLRQAKVVKILMDRDRRGIELWLKLDRYLDKEKLNRICLEVQKLYGLDRLQLHCRYEGIELTADYAPMLAQYLGQVCPGCRGFLDDAAMTVEEDRVTLALTHGGGEALARAEGRRILSELLLEEFGKHYAVEFTGVLELQELTEGLSIAPPIKAEPRRIAVKQGIARRSAGELLCGKRFDGAPVPMRSVDLDSGSVTVEGEVFGLESRASKNGKTVIVSFNLTDLTSSLPVKMFLQIEKAEQLLSKLKDGSYIRLRGEMQLDRYTNELAVMARDILQVEKKVRKDNAPKKRVELHLHTTMSQMDAVTPVEAYLKRAAEWGHPALAITDHGVLQAYPDACNSAKKAGFEGKILYGIEAYFISENDSDSSPRQDSFADPFVIFDLETTGLSPRTDRMTEIGAVLVREGEVLDRFHTFVNPARPIPYEVTKLTGITDEMVRNAPSEQEALSEFQSFVKGYTLVAHNASFDVSFLRAAAGRCGTAVDNPSVDTLAIARCALPQLKNHRLDTLAAHFQVSLRHHRADNDAEALSQIFFGLTELGKAQGASTVQELFEVFGNRRDLRLARTYHLIILAKNMVGLKNLFRLVSKSNLEYFGNKRPKIPKSELLRHREGLILGSACEAGELFTAIVNGAPREELLRIASFYDYLEIQPISNNRFLVANGTAKDDDQLRAYNKTVVSLGEELDIPVCATGDVHFLEPEDEIFRSILLASQGYEDADRQNPLYFRTTEEMLEEFSYLGEEKAFEVVVTNTNLVADWCDTVVPLKKGMFPPEIPGADQELRVITAKKAKELYGDPLPERVRERLERELDPIIGNGYAVMYIIARRLVQESRRNGYLVGSRGSVGSSLAAYFAQITEVNALPPHYVCPSCHFIRFDDSGAYEAGCDMPDLICPNCGSKCRKDGFNIPFETFMGFSGEKVPDIDLNFSGEYQTQAHKYAESLFPRRHVFRAGTIATVAEKTAFGYVKKYLAERGRVVPRAEEERLVRGCTGIKRTTGQHPGGIMVVPEAFDIEDFTPVQHPADDPDKNVVTTHFDYHAIHDNILKLDMLGHDDPTALRMLGDLTGIDVTTLPLNDPEVLALFSGVESLKLMPGENVGNNGSIAIPEFGTGFVRGMLEQTKPTTVGELVRISGLSHGTDVWLGNAETLIRNNTCSLREAICCRDDIMTYLIQKGLPKSDSFKIMEQVRKGKGVSEEQAGLMREHSVPDWYIDSCRAIKYLFPRAHAVAYVTMALRIAWFKVHHPLPFYATYFSVRADAFDASVMTKGKAALEQLQRDVANLDKKSMKDEDRATVAEVCLEMLARGYTFLPVDLYRSDATTFLIEGNALRPPLASLPGVGENAAAAIAQAREGRAFTSQEELIAQARVSRAVVETLAQNGALGDLPVSAQLSLF